MRRSDPIKQILDRKSRLSDTQRFIDLTGRLIPLAEIFKAIEVEKESSLPIRIREELMRYLPIAVIACIEGYFRLLFRDLIDAGSPYIDNLRSFEDRDLRFKIDDIVAIQKETVSLGDFISHLLPINSLEEINYCMSTLLGKDFLESLKSSPFISPSVYKGVKRLFELRHIFAHELATKEKLDIKKCETIIGAGVSFLMATETMISQVYKIY